MENDVSPTSVVIAGGGTGGHLMPGLAVAGALRQAGVERIAFVGTAHGLEARLVPAAGYELRLIAIGGLKSSGLARRLKTLGQLPWAVAQSVRILRATGTGVVLGIGGYASGPVLAAAALLRIPVVLLEVNAKTGLANRLAAPWAQAAAVNFPATAHDFRHAVVTGIPVRPEFYDFRPLGALQPSPLVLVFGGSQGARALNQVVADMARHPPLPYRLRHQTGPDDFIADMAAAMAEATVVVCRAGASTLGELAAAGRAAILVPLPGAADQHQLRNAQAYAQAGAALVIEQAQLTPTRLAGALAELLGDRTRREGMERAVRTFAHPRAAAEIAELVLRARKTG